MLTTTPVAVAKQSLGQVQIYVAMQRVVGADRLRYQCLEILDARPGDRVLDVGCGPAYYLDRLPAVDYLGYDTDQRYIAWAKNRFGGRGQFTCAEFGPEQLEEVGQVDAVLLMGLLHHVDDQGCDALLALLARALRPGGRVVSVDTAYCDGQPRFARWMADNDRDEFVRHPAEYQALAARHFSRVQGHLLEAITRVPGSYWAMHMAAPLPSR